VEKRARGAELGDQAASEADGDRMRARARLQLCEQMADVGLDRLFGEEEADSDLTVDEPVRDQLEHFDLPHRGLLLQLAEGAAERDDLCITALPLGSDRFEAALVVHVAAQDLLALSSVHACPIGRLTKPL
jgi:hypothetical protein